MSVCLLYSPIVSVVVKCSVSSSCWWYKILDKYKNGYVARDQLLYVL